MIMSLVWMGSGGGQVCDVVSVKLLVLIIVLIFIVNIIIGGSLIVVRFIGYSGANTFMIAGEFDT